MTLGQSSPSCTGRSRVWRTTRSGCRSCWRDGVTIALGGGAAGAAATASSVMWLACWPYGAAGHEMLRRRAERVPDRPDPPARYIWVSVKSRRQAARTQDSLRARPILPESQVAGPSCRRGPTSSAASPPIAMRPTPTPLASKVRTTPDGAPTLTPPDTGSGRTPGRRERRRTRDRTRRPPAPPPPRRYRARLGAADYPQSLGVGPSPTLSRHAVISDSGADRAPSRSGTTANPRTSPAPRRR
jgi:hypothetical protein